MSTNTNSITRLTFLAYYCIRFRRVFFFFLKAKRFLCCAIPAFLLLLFYLYFYFWDNLRTEIALELSKKETNFMWSHVITETCFSHKKTAQYRCWLEWIEMKYKKNAYTIYIIYAWTIILLTHPTVSKQYMYATYIYICEIQCEFVCAIWALSNIKQHTDEKVKTWQSVLSGLYDLIYFVTSFTIALCHLLRSLHSFLVILQLQLTYSGMSRKGECGSRCYV